MIYKISMYSAWLKSTFLRLFKFLQFKEEGPDFFKETDSAERPNYLVPSSVCNF